MKRPWNIIPAPIYSLATYDQNNRVNMNICSYVTPVSMQPKMYAVGIFLRTKTHENMCNTRTAILQLMQRSQLELVNRLGKKSGLKVDKEEMLMRDGLLSTWHGRHVLKDAAACLLLEKQKSFITGDHEMFIFNVRKYSSFSSDDILSLQDLVRARVIL